MNGLLIVDKPSGPTSHDIVDAARRALGESRIGHTGTLDPLATGVLPLVCGQATRLVRFLIASDKTYQATIRFGLTTDTFDVTGTALTRSATSPTRERVEQALASRVGDHAQMPPPYSAKKVGGRRAYQMARQGVPVVLEPVRVRLMAATLDAFDGDRARVTLACSAGFYVRSFAQTLGELVGTGACLEALRRTRSGEFDDGSAVTLEDLMQAPARAAARMIPLDRLLLGFPAVHLSDEERRRVSHGQDIDHPTDTTAAWVRLLDADGHLVALAVPREGLSLLRPTVVLT